MKKGKRRSSHPEAFWEKRVLKICSKFTGEHPCRSLICNFIEIALPHGFSPVNLLHIFRTPFPKNIPGRLLLKKKALFHISHIFHKSLSCNFLVFHIESKRKKMWSHNLTCKKSILRNFFKHTNGAFLSWKHASVRMKIR